MGQPVIVGGTRSADGIAGIVPHVGHDSQRGWNTVLQNEQVLYWSSDIGDQLQIRENFQRSGARS